MGVVLLFFGKVQTLNLQKLLIVGSLLYSDRDMVRSKSDITLKRNEILTVNIIMY